MDFELALGQIQYHAPGPRGDFCHLGAFDFRRGSGGFGSQNRIFDFHISRMFPGDQSCSTHQQDQDNNDPQASEQTYFKAPPLFTHDCAHAFRSQQLKPDRDPT